MATPDFNLCDICGEKVSKTCRLEVITDQRRDIMVHTSKRTVDLCPKHQADVIQLLLENPSEPKAADPKQGRRVSVFIDQMKRATAK